MSKNEKEEKSHIQKDKTPFGNPQTIYEAKQDFLTKEELEIMKKSKELTMSEKDRKKDIIKQNQTPFGNPNTTYKIGQDSYTIEELEIMKKKVTDNE